MRPSVHAVQLHSRQLNTVAALSALITRMTMSDLFTSLDRTGIRRRLEPAPVLQPRTPHSSTCARLCTLFSCTRVFLVLGAPTVHLLQMHISRDLRDRTMSVTLTAACSESAPGRPLHPATRVNSVMARGKSLMPRPRRASG